MGSHIAQNSTEEFWSEELGVRNLEWDDAREQRDGRFLRHKNIRDIRLRGGKTAYLSGTPSGGAAIRRLKPPVTLDDALAGIGGCVHFLDGGE